MNKKHYNRELKQLEEALIYFDWRIKNAPDLETSEKFYQMGLDASHIYKRLSGHFPTKYCSHVRGKK